MVLKARRILFLAALLGGLQAPALLAGFVPPADGPVAFRRDRIPLDTDAIARLSGTLGTLAGGLKPESATELRGAAQMLALSLALDPGNQNARQLLGQFENGKPGPGPKGNQLVRARARIWQYISWLETPEAGADGQALSACLKDVIILSDPKDPRAEELIEGGEMGAWAKWVPQPAAYQDTVEPPEIPPDPVPTPKNPPAVAATELKLKKAQVSTVLWQPSTPPEKGVPIKWVMAPATVAMTASITAPEEGEKPAHFSVMVGSEKELKTFGSTRNALQTLLRSRNSKLPRGCVIHIDSSALRLSAQAGRRQSISAATAVLANAALSGQEPDAIVIGRIAPDGAFLLPSGFWYQLTSLGKGNGKRLVLPAGAADYLASVLAMEKPEFFLQYQVLLASNLDQLLERCAVKPGEATAASITEFREIQKRGAGQDVRQYLSNRFVRQRLGEVVQDAPYNFSAKMLLIQAAGDRPIIVTRPVLADELRRVIEKMEWIVKLQIKTVTKEQTAGFGPTYDACRSRLDALETYANKNDSELMDHTRDLVIAIRNLDRAARSRGLLYTTIGEPLAAFVKQYKEVSTELDGETTYR